MANLNGESKLKKYIFNFIILICLLVFQLLLPLMIPSLKLIPDFVLIYVVIRAIIFGAKDGMIYGAFGGLIQDVFLNSFFGLFTPLKIAVAFLTALFSGRFFPENLFIPPFAVFMASIVHELFYLLLKENYLFAANYLELFKEIILPLAAVNALLTLIIYLFYLYRERWGLSG